jgi:RNA polymerase II subunit A small phosphatase-like protein
MWEGNQNCLKETSKDMMEDRMIIILDLDETLVHATLTKLDRPESFRFENHYVYVRPYLNEFIENCNQFSSLAIWSSAGQEYVHTIVNRFIPPSIKLNFIWTRPNYMTPDALKWGNTKNLKRLIANGFEPSRALIIDDNPDESVCEFGNVLEVQPYRGENEDCELLLLSRYLQKVELSEDTRDIARPSWRDEAKAPPTVSRQ